MTTAVCAVCCATLTLNKKFDPPYCKTRACAEGYAPILVRSRIHVRNGHVIWSGSYHPATGRPYCTLSYIGAGERRTLTVNPMDLLWPGERPGHGYTLSRTCEEARCISHLALQKRAVATRKAAPAPEPKAPMLPTAPLVEYVQRRGIDIAERVGGAKDAEGGGNPPYDWFNSLVNGGVKTANLYRIDEFCIEVLGIHPALVYGDSFYTA